MFENFSCNADGILVFEDLDGFRCALAKMTLILYNINFGYICVPFLFLNALISISGGIKQSYRWIILNQVIWDVLLTCKFIYFNEIFLIYQISNKIYMNEIFGAFLNGIPYASYSSLMLLTFSRFLAVYFPHFYEKFTNKHRIFITLFIYNFVVFITSQYILFNTLREKRIEKVLCPQYVRYDLKEYIEIPKCLENPPYDIIVAILTVIKDFEFVSTQFIPPFCLIISIISTTMIIIKISKQFKFQKTNNPKEFYISLRISSVILFHTLLYSIIFCFEGIFDIVSIMYLFGINTKFVNNLPKWYNFLSQYSLTFPAVIQNFVQIRIFLESIIILFFMGGYREDIIRFFKFIFKFFESKIAGESQTQVTVINNTLTEGSRITSQSLRH